MLISQSIADGVAAVNPLSGAAAAPVWPPVPEPLPQAPQHPEYSPQKITILKNSDTPEPGKDVSGFGGIVFLYENALPDHST